MWAGISLEDKTQLVFVPGVGRRAGLTADGYITNIFLEHVVPYAGFVDEDFILMHDNARCHTARVTQQFLREVDLRTMDWPALSPDINPVEHLWDELNKGYEQEIQPIRAFSRIESSFVRGVGRYSSRQRQIMNKVDEEPNTGCN
ncbi:unnamed protein product [Pieris macdunnoughi]|nr:unnamed protein product [Pieris macdunnoughi]